MTSIASLNWEKLRALVLNVFFVIALGAAPPAASDEESYEEYVSKLTSTPDGLVQLMMMGILAHDLELLETSIAHEVDINATTQQGETALFMAASLGHQEIVRMLLQYSPPLEVDKANAEQWTPLMAAVSSGHAEIASLLLNAGADADRSVPLSATESISAQKMALLSDDPDMVALFDPQAAEALREKYEQTLSTLALFEGAVDGDAALIEDSLGSLKMLGHPNSITDENGWTPLMHAAANGHVDAVRLLIDSGYDVNQRLGAEQMTPLMAAAANEDVNMIKLLIQYDADITIKQRQSMTALDIAKAIGAQPAVLEPLGFRFESIDPIATMRNGNAAQILALLDTREITPNWRDEQGWTALMHAADGNNLRAAIVLLDEYGSKQTEYATNDDQSALTIAIARGHDKMVKLLIDQGAPVEQKIGGSMSLDAFASARNQPALAQALKETIKSQTLALQQELFLAEYDVGRPDGIAGKMTIDAFNKFISKNQSINTYASAIKFLKDKRSPGRWWVCNVSRKDEIWYTMSINKDTVRGWWSVKKNTCKSDTIGKSSGNYFSGIYFFSSDRKPTAGAKLLCAPRVKFTKKITDDCGSDNKPYNYDRRGKNGIVVWIEGQ